MFRQLGAILSLIQHVNKEPYGDVAYADPGFQTDKKKRYPLDTESHIRAAWSYIHKAQNRLPYTQDELFHIERAIIKAWKTHINPDGPPEAAK